jgi:hypothetical protein
MCVCEREKERGEMVGTLGFTRLMAAAEPPMEMDNSIAIQSKEGELLLPGKKPQAAEWRR